MTTSKSVPQLQAETGMQGSGARSGREAEQQSVPGVGWADTTAAVQEQGR